MIKSFKKINKNGLKIVIFVFLTTFPGFYITGAFNSIGNFIIAAIGAFLAFCFFNVAVESEVKSWWRFTDKPFYEVKKIRHQNTDVRISSYLLCICVLYTVSALFVAIGSAGAEVGDKEESTGLVATEDVPPAPYYKQRQWHNNMFFALLVPSLLGVRFGLGELEKNQDKI